jgi:hypothetical protein
MNDRRNNFSEAVITEGRREIVGLPRNQGVFLPLYAAFDTLYSQSIHITQPILKCYGAKNSPERPYNNIINGKDLIAKAPGDD